VKKLARIKIHNQFQKELRNLQSQFSIHVNNKDYTPLKLEQRAIQLYWYLVFDEWMTCKHLENDFLEDLWDNYYRKGAQRALQLIPFKSSLDNMIKQGTSFFDLKDEFLNSFYNERRNE